MPAPPLNGSRASEQRQVQLNLFPMVWPGHVGRPRPVGDRTAGLTQRQVAVLAALLSASGRLLTMRELADAAELVSDEAARAITKRLRARGLLAVTQVRGCRQGFTAELLLTDDEWESRTGRHVRTLAQTDLPVRTPERSEVRSPVRTVQPHESATIRPEASNGEDSQPAPTPHQPTGRVRTASWPPVRTPRLPGVRTKSSIHAGSLTTSGPGRPDAARSSEDRKKENLSFSKQLESWSHEAFAEFWPHLARIGFTVAKAREIVRSREEKGLPCDLLRMGLEHAEAAVAMGLERMAKGEKVLNPLGYIYKALHCNGYFDKPPGFLSAEERAARDAAERAEALCQAHVRLEKANFELWRLHLSQQEIEAVTARDPKNRFGPLEMTLKNEWRRLGQPVPPSPQDIQPAVATA